MGQLLEAISTTLGRQSDASGRIVDWCCDSPVRGPRASRHALCALRWLLRAGHAYQPVVEGEGCSHHARHALYDWWQYVPILFEGSKMHVWGVNTIPITPATHNLPAEVMARLTTTPTRLHKFYPKGLLPHNIGSNEGLAKVMRVLMQDMGLEPGA